MGWPRKLCSVAIAVAVCAVTQVAVAQRVLLVQPTGPDETLAEAFNRLRAELALQGFEISVLQLVASASSPEGLSELARQQQAFAAISLTRSAANAGAVVCVADRVTGKVTLRTLALDGSKDAPSVLAVRATELLRSSLSEIAGAKKPPPDVVGVDRGSVPAEVREFARAPAVRFRLDVRAAALGVSQRIGPGYAPSLGLSYRVGERWGVGLVFAGPAFGTTFHAGNGSATVRQELGLSRLWLSALSTERFELRPSVLLGVYRADVVGQVSAPFASRSGSVTSFAAGVGLDLGLRLGERLVVGGELSALTLSPRPVIAVLEDEYRYAPVIVNASVGVGVEL